MTMPPEIHICGIRFTLDVFEKDEFGFALGYADIAVSTIMLNEKLSMPMRRQTVMHEIVHVVDALLADGKLVEELKKPGGSFAPVCVACGSRAVAPGEVWRCLNCGSTIDKPDESIFRLEEPTVVAFSHGLWATLADPRNAQVVKWMLEQD